MCSLRWKALLQFKPDRKYPVKHNKSSKSHQLFYSNMGTRSPILAYAKYSTYYIMDKRICLNDLDPTAIATHFSDVMIFCFVNDCYGSFMSETSVHKTNSRMGRQNKDKEKLRDSLMQISGCVLILFVLHKFQFHHRQISFCYGRVLESRNSMIICTHKQERKKKSRNQKGKTETRHNN